MMSLQTILQIKFGRAITVDGNYVCSTRALTAIEHAGIVREVAKWNREWDDGVLVREDAVPAPTILYANPDALADFATNGKNLIEFSRIAVGPFTQRVELKL